ncbi:hypothetical protein KP79_PYT21087 [Mizuhopecten yessoensis]|uniref:Uncharacterized protein n=1 Tax=Mizuhopecten yessoensis TaxID=6573 RepID=A0A210Q5V3_MIZYE|nr:hypothetical protein KP79_PYT21087 [Mizuhopecten yessoensis]
MEEEVRANNNPGKEVVVAGIVVADTAIEVGKIRMVMVKKGVEVDGEEGDGEEEDGMESMKEEGEEGDREEGDGMESMKEGEEEETEAESDHRQGCLAEKLACGNMERKIRNLLDDIQTGDNVQPQPSRSGASLDQDVG